MKKRNRGPSYRARQTFRQSLCFVVTISAARRPSATGSWLLWWLVKEMKHIRHPVSEVFQRTPASKRRKTAVKCAVETGGGKENVSRKDVEMIGKEPYLSRMWEYFLQERNRVKRFPGLADEKQEGLQGQWQQESPAREYLEQVKCCRDTGCNEPMTKKGFTALKNENWDVKTPSGKR